MSDTQGAYSGLRRAGARRCNTCLPAYMEQHGTPDYIKISTAFGSDRNDAMSTFSLRQATQLHSISGHVGKHHLSNQP